jgi:hypothetical protein
MRHSKAEKTKTHERIVALASKRFREEGLSGIGIAELMKEAGLTVGGFYKRLLIAVSLHQITCMADKPETISRTHFKGIVSS